MFTSLWTIQPTIAFHGYPSVSKEVGTHVPSPPPESVQSGDTPSSRQWELVGVADLEMLKQMKIDHGMATVAIYLMDDYACLIR